MTEREILDKTIRDAQGVIDKAKADLERLKESTYSIGDRFKGKSREKYILASTMPDSYNNCANVVSLKTGWLYGKHDIWVGCGNKIKQAELDDMLWKNPDKLVRYYDAKKERDALDKPKLRHGDYGLDWEGRACLRVKHPANSGYKWFVADKTFSYGNSSGVVAVPKTILGNVFDDIARMTK